MATLTEQDKDAFRFFVDPANQQGRSAVVLPNAD